MDTRPVRVFLLDDHEVVRRGVRRMIEACDDLVVVGEAETAAQARVRIPLASPQVAVLDVQLEDGSGIDVCRELRSAHPDISCLMLTTFEDSRAVLESAMAGASGYLIKQIKGTELLDGIRRIAAGDTLFDARTIEVAAELRFRSEEVDPRLARLTPKEERILELLADGLSNRQIGELLFLAEKTVKNYVSNLLTKLGMSRRTEAAVYAVALQGGSAPLGGGGREPEGR